ncbi:hypothetical protein C5167_022564 [Papaver somniferum]|uniref:Uncharacterized protein n=1 Tax=Papaver somniferum TaxID=3469 RepID=A0A4Y7JLY6_PAPSO|nr:hypothetical protein C5167_022564 [Papaver somniferum]
MRTFSGLAAGIKPVLNFKVEGSSGAVNDMESTMVQKFWDSSLALDPPEDDYDTQRIIRVVYICSIELEEHLSQVGVDTTTNNWNEALVLGSVYFI